MYNTRFAVWRFLRRKKKGMRYYANFLVIISPPTFLNSVYPSRHFSHCHNHSHTSKVWQGIHKNTNNNCFWRMGISDSFLITSVQFSRSVVSHSLWPHESQHARPPCPSPTRGVHPDSRPSSQWCHLAISSSVVPFSSYPQSLPASESFPMSQLFAWGGQSTGVSALASFIPKKSLGWSPSK